MDGAALQFASSRLDRPRADLVVPEAGTSARACDA